MKTNQKIIERIVRKADVPDLVEILANRLSLPDLQSLLLEVYRRRTQALSPQYLVTQYEQNRFVQPANVSPQKFLEFDRLAFSVLPPDFEVIELSPVCPLGTNSIIATVDQNNVVSTIRNTEVCSDSTNVLALECARRRRKILAKNPRSPERIKLCSSHRVLRAQPFDAPAAFAHFRLLGLCTSGRDEGSFTFEVESLVEQIEFYLHLIEESKKLGYNPGNIQVKLTAFHERRLEALSKKVLEPLASKYQGIGFAFDQDRESGRSYYVDAGFQIYVSELSGTEYFIVDGGFTNWTQLLLNNHKERLLISGMGSERFLYCFES